jgi:hypothetical protein
MASAAGNGRPRRQASRLAAEKRRAARAKAPEFIDALGLISPAAAASAPPPLAAN